jgi:hypothetical protein
MSLRSIFVSLVAASVLVPAVTSAQKPDFSGDWVLVESLATGSTRTSAGGGGGSGVRSSSNTISGAAFNCGRACTITQKGQTLTISNAQLADYAGKDKSRPTPSLTLRLDGREAEVVDTFNPDSKIVATTKWDGNKIQIDSGRPPSTIRRTQILSIEGAQLVVDSVAYIQGERRPELTLKYKRK